MKKLGISFIYIITTLLVLTLIFTLFNYFSFKDLSIIKMFIPIVSLFIGGIYLGLNTRFKGFCNGLKLGILFVLFMIILNIIFISEFEIKSILYYLILLISTSLGSMIGINLKKSN